MLRVKANLTFFLTAVLTLAGCGAPESEPAAGADPMISPAQMPEDAAEPEIPPLGEFILSGEAPFIMQATETGISCQSASPGSPFRAQWTDTASGMNVLVTGWPDTEGSDDYRVDNFQVVQIFRTDRTEARLSGATLNVEEISRRGYSVLYSVRATGTFVEGGNFSASGHCRA